MTAADVTGDYRPGDVVQYESLERPNRWCREEVAIATVYGDELHLIDTYWSMLGSESHHLTAAEVATAQPVEFNVNDWERLPYERRAEWERYAEADRRSYTEQHGLRSELFIRPGASYDIDQMIANAQRAVQVATADLHAATGRLEWEAAELARLVKEKANR